MPINAAHRHRYPLHGQAIRAAILDRVGHRCEPCGVPNHVWRNNRTEAWTHDAGLAEAWILDGTRVTRIGLTIAHLDHTPETCASDNLRALCPRGPLAHDRNPHRQNADHSRRVSNALGDLFPTPNTQPSTTVNSS